MDKKTIFYMKIAFVVVCISVISVAMYANLANNTRVEEFLRGSTVSVKVVKAKNVDLRPSIKLLPASIIDLGLDPGVTKTAMARATGLVTNVFVQEGQTVEAGQVIAEMETSELMFQMQARQASLAAAIADRRESEKDVQRYDALLKSGATSEQQYSKAVQAAEKTKSAEQQVLTDIAILDTKIAKSSIVAPASGTVYSMFVRAGASVTNGAPVCEISSAANKVKMKLTISNNERHYFIGGEKIIVESLSSGDTGSIFNRISLPGVVKQIYLNSNLPASSWIAEVELTELKNIVFPLLSKIHFSGQNLEYELINSLYVMFFDGARLTFPSYNMLVLPNKAILTDSDGYYVYVLGADNYAYKRPIQLGGYENKELGIVDVVAGIEDGDQVVVSGQQRLSDGAKVNVELIVQPQY